MFEIITVTVVLSLFGAAAIYAHFIEKHLEVRYAEKRKATLNNVKETSNKQVIKEKPKNTSKKKVTV